MGEIDRQNRSENKLMMLVQRIKLTKNEKRILKHLSTHGYDALCDFPRSEAVYSLDTLEQKGLVKNLRVEGGDIEDARLSSLGKSYMRCNPKLTNPINWDRVIAISTLIVAIITLLSACVLIG